MKIGVVFPQTELGSDPIVARDYVQAVEGLGYDHILIYDHVVGADPDRPGGWNRAYDVDTNFHEPFVFYGYLAGLTQKLELVTNIIILPQRQAVLVAKQAAEVDVLSGGRLRLGVGLGWNHIEYQALNENFETRGRRMAEQIEVMRQLWTKGTVDFEGKYHTIDKAGIRPMPVQRPIPVWMGGGHPSAVRRLARHADGWFPQMTIDQAPAAMEQLWQEVDAAGRKRGEIGIEARTESSRMRDPEEWDAFIDAWKQLGATHMGISTMGAGFTSPAEHLAEITRFKEIVSPYATTA
jgi:probable F420-dependent oxidoreductase